MLGFRQRTHGANFQSQGASISEMAKSPKLFLRWATRASQFGMVTVTVKGNTSPKAVQVETVCLLLVETTFFWVVPICFNPV